MQFDRNKLRDYETVSREYLMNLTDEHLLACSLETIYHLIELKQIFFPINSTLKPPERGRLLPLSSVGMRCVRGCLRRGCSFLIYRCQYALMENSTLVLSSIVI